VKPVLNHHKSFQPNVNAVNKVRELSPKFMKVDDISKNHQNSVPIPSKTKRFMNKIIEQPGIPNIKNPQKS